MRGLLFMLFVSVASKADQVSQPPVPQEELNKCDSMIKELPPVGSDCCGRMPDGDSYALINNPWTVSLMADEGKAVCKGSLITNRHILTAAHCLIRNEIKHVRFGYEEKQCSDLPKESNGNTNTSFCVGIKSFKIHTKFIHLSSKMRQSGRNDIALISLTNPVRYTDYVRPICMPPTGAVRKELLLVTGYGENRREVRMFPVSEEKCQKSRINVDIWDAQICAVGEQGEDSCRGDSGGPLMTNFSSRFELSGLVSYGSIPCGNKVPAVYTRVASYIQWILATISLMTDTHIEPDSNFTEYLFSSPVPITTPESPTHDSTTISAIEDRNLTSVSSPTSTTDATDSNNVDITPLMKAFQQKFSSIGKDIERGSLHVQGLVWFDFKSPEAPSNDLLEEQLIMKRK